LSNYNVFSSQWDKNYYTYYKDGIFTYLNGYASSLELPSFFGSKLINLPTSLSIENWDKNNYTFINTELYNKFEFNISKQIINIFKNYNYNVEFVGHDSLFAWK